MQIRNLQNHKVGLLSLLLAAAAIASPLGLTTHADSIGNDQQVTKEQSQQGQHSDAWITAQVKAKLLAEHFRTGMDVKVTTEDGVVKLSGYVNKADEVALADKVASGVEGVVRVQNDLTIK